MIIRNCMKQNVFWIPATAAVRDAVAVLVARHIGLLPVLDADQRPIGVVGLRDLLNLALPSSFTLLADVDFIGDFGALESFVPGKEILSKPITALMRPATMVREDSGLIRAYAIMLQHDLHDLPVVDEAGRLSGIASRVDIGTRILTGWT
jgi:CBS domain-containing protein